MALIITNTDYNGNAMPRLANESKLIAPGSPVAVIGLFVLAVRHRFTPGTTGEGFIGGGSVDGMEHTPDWHDPTVEEPIPWIWQDGLRPTDECTVVPGEPDARKPILIDAAFNNSKGPRNYRPAIFIDRGDVTPAPIAVSNFAGMHQPSGGKAYMILTNMAIAIECHSELPVESCLIAETVWSYILATRLVFRHHFGLYDISEPVLSRTLPENEDKDVWKTTVTFNVQIEHRWGVRRIEPLINDVMLNVVKYGSPDVYYAQIAMRDTQREP